MQRMTARVRAMWRALRRADQLDASVHEEMRFHIDMEAERLMRERGRHPNDARRLARVAFGGLGDAPGRAAVAARVSDRRPHTRGAAARAPTAGRAQVAGCTVPARPHQTIYVKCADPADNPVWRAVQTDEFGCFEDF